MAAIVYKTVRGVAENNQATARVDIDMDMMMGVTTETIDMVTEVARAAQQILPGSNEQQLKEDVLLRTTILHGEQLGDENGEFSAEMKQAAATDLRDYMSDAGAQKAFDYVNTRAKTEGINPNDMMRAGNEALFGTKNPLAEGINRGLMESRLPPRAGQSASKPVGGGVSQEGYIPSVAEIQQQMDTAKAQRGDQPLMGGPETRSPEQANPLPPGEGIVPSGMNYPPPEDPNAELVPRPQGGY